MHRIALCILLLLCLAPEIWAQVASPQWTGLHRIDIDSWSTIVEETKSKAEITLHADPSLSIERYNGFCGIELHGNSTLNAPKKSYDFELRTHDELEHNASLFGMAPGDDFVLLSCYFDRSFLRSALAFELWKQLGHDAPEYRFCELYVNSKYQGLYLLTERIKVDSNRVDIGPVPNGVTPGRLTSPPFLLRFDWKHSDALPFGKSLTGESMHIRFEYPKRSNMSASLHHYYAFLNEVERTFQKAAVDKVAYYDTLIDLPSFADFFLINELAKNPDGLKTSAYFYREYASLADRDPPLKAGPVWDFDLAFDNVSYAQYNEPVGWGFEQTGHMSNARLLPVWWHVLASNPAFRQRCARRLKDLQTQSSVEQLETYLLNLSFNLGEAIARDAALWEPTRENFTNDAGPLQRTTHEDALRVTSFFQKRIDWLAQALRTDEWMSPLAAQRAARTTLEVRPVDAQLQFSLWPDSVLFDSEQHFTCTILNRGGQVVMEKWEWTSTNGWMELNTFDWPPGEYYLEVLQDATTMNPYYDPYDLLPVTSYAPRRKMSAVQPPPRPILAPPTVSYVTLPITHPQLANTSAITPWDIYYSNAIPVSMHNYVRIVVE